jgi:ubiquinone/menaquinone biosynthesis C-methylase UbiE
MGFEGAAWLEREGRDQEEKPEVVLAAMELKPGMRVAEIGAGTGYFSRRIGKEIGPEGKVYAVDIEPRMLELLKKYAAEVGVANIVTVTGEESDPKLAPGSVDRILLVDVYHEFQDPQPMLRHIARALAPGGRVILVEYRAEDDSAKHILAEHRMSVEQVLGEWQPAGFRLLRRLETLPSQHLFVFSYEPG